MPNPEKSPVTKWWPVWVRARAASSKETVSSVPTWFRADSGTNLIKQGEIVTGRPCGSVAQWSECLHGLREVLGSSSDRAMCFFPPLPCDIWWPVWGLCNAPATFQRLMEKCMGEMNLRDCLIYLDDIVAFSSGFEEHLQKLEAVFKRLHNQTLKLKG